ncbi:MAG: hypothetical protein ACOYN5_02130 [Bacteroidales bacterium]
MLIKFLRSSFATQYALILLIAICLYIPTFLFPIIPEITTTISGPLYEPLSIFFHAFPLFSVIASFIILLFQAYFFNSILAANGLINRQSVYGTFVYVLLFSQSPHQLGMYPSLVAGIFILFALSILFGLEDKTENQMYIFNSSILVSLASMFYLPALILIFWLWIALLMSRSGSFRELLIPIVGLITPYFFLASWYYFKNQLFGNASEYLDIFKLFDFEKINPDWSVLVIWIIIILILFQFSYIILGVSGEKNAVIRKKKSITITLLFFSIPGVFYNDSQIMHNGLIILPIAVLISYSLANVRKRLIPEILLWLLLVSIIANHYLPYFT